jgi:hypothetical protein
MRIEESPSIKGAAPVIQGCGAGGDGGLSLEVAVGRAWAGGGLVMLDGRPRYALKE